MASKLKVESIKLANELIDSEFFKVQKALNTLDMKIGIYRQVFIQRLSQTCSEFLQTNMSTDNDTWRRKVSNMELAGKGLSRNGGYNGFSVQPLPYSLGLFKTCFAAYFSQILSYLNDNNFWLTDQFTSKLIFDGVTAVFMAWLKYIVEKKIKFSAMGARQLEADFQNVQFLIEESFPGTAGSSPGTEDVKSFVTLEERKNLFVRKFRSLPIVSQLRSVVYILLTKSKETNQHQASSTIQATNIDSPSGYRRSPSVESSTDLLNEGSKSGRRRRRNRRTGSVAPLTSADSYNSPRAGSSHSVQSHPVPFGAEIWLALADSDSRTGFAAGLFRSSSSNNIPKTCTPGCMPRWRAIPS